MQKSAKVIVGWGYEPSERMEVSRPTEGPNVRKAKELESLYRSENNRTSLANSRIEWRPEAGNHAGGVEQSYAAGKDNADVIFF